MKACLLGPLFSLSFIIVIHAQGTLDTAFGVGGKVSVSPEISDMAIQADGKIVTINKYDNVDYNFHLFRYSNNGATDSSFGTAGAIDTQIPHAGLTFGRGIAIQPDGKIISVGSTIKSNTSFDYAFLRYLPDGNLDSSFGKNGSVVIDAGQNNDEYLYKVALQPDGKIVACGNESYGIITLIRLKPDGNRDSSFGIKGIATLTYAGFNNGYALSIQKDGKILVGGSNLDVSGDGYVRVLVTRFNKNGTVDSSFGVNGIVLLRYGVNGDTEFRSMKLLDDGNIILGSQISIVGKIAIARLKPNGSFDSSFADNGLLKLISPNNKLYDLETLTVQSDNKIVIDGIFNGNNEQVVLRFMSNGSLDTTFGDGGKTITVFGNLAYYYYLVNASAIQNNGDILFGGNLITRYHDDAKTLLFIVKK